MTYDRKLSVTLWFVSSCWPIHDIINVMFHTPRYEQRRHATRYPQHRGSKILLSDSQLLKFYCDASVVPDRSPARFDLFYFCLQGTVILLTQFTLFYTSFTPARALRPSLAETLTTRLHTWNVNLTATDDYFWDSSHLVQISLKWTVCVKPLSISCNAH